MGIKLMGLFSAVMHWGWMELISLVSCTVWAQTGLLLLLYDIATVMHSLLLLYDIATVMHSLNTETILTNVMDAFGMNKAVLTTYWV